VARAPSKQKRGSALTKAMRRPNQKVLSSQRKAAEAEAALDFIYRVAVAGPEKDTGRAAGYGEV
jgi:hypothetical protein